MHSVALPPVAHSLPASFYEQSIAPADSANAVNPVPRLRTAHPFERAIVHSGRTALGLVPAAGPVALRLVPPPAPRRVNTVAWHAAEVVLEVVVTAPFSGGGAILANLVGSKLLGIAHDGYEFHGGRSAVNGLLSGMTLAPLAVGVRMARTATRDVGAHHLMQRLLTFLGSVVFGASAGALAAAIGHSRGFHGESVPKATAAGALATAIFGALAALLGSHTTLLHAASAPAAPEQPGVALELTPVVTRSVSAPASLA